MSYRRAGAASFYLADKTHNPATLRWIIATGLSLVLMLLLLSGWGLDGWRTFFAQPARLAMSTLMVSGIFFLALSNLGSEPLRRGRKARTTETLALAVMASASCWLVWLLPHDDARGILVFQAGEWLRWLGLALLCLGGAVRIKALHDLGPQFSAYVTLQPGHRLVNTGIYRLVRHPLYVSLLLAAPGFALVFRSELLVPIGVVTAAFVANRIRSEERLLTDYFGDAYREYRSRSWSLIPFMV